MYTLAVRRSFIARHALIGGDWGRENQPNSHRFTLEVQIQASQLDQHGFLVDIVDLDRHVDAVVERFGDQFLNDLPEFQGLNPSLEHFARIIAQQLQAALPAFKDGAIKVVLWEDDSAWASFAGSS